MSRRPTNPDLKDALAELKRERRTRDPVYARLIDAGRLSKADVDARGRSERLL